MSESNTAFKTFSSSQGKTTVHTDGDNIVVRFNSALPTEYTFHTPSMDRTFYRLAREAGKQLDSHLSNRSDEEKKALRDKFSDETYALHSEVLDEIVEKHQKKLIEELEKIGAAVDKVAKAKILEYAHLAAEELEHGKTKLEKLTKDFIKEHA